MIKSRHIGDVDIDFADRTKALEVIDHVPASMIRNGKIDRHNTGVYCHAVPTDPLTGLASMHYEIAESRGWYKIDLLNVHVYEGVRNEEHLLALMGAELDWKIFEYQEFTSKLIHLGNHAQLVADLKPTSISDLSMILALIRPAKRYLIEKCRSGGFPAIGPDIWIEPTDGTYHFKKSHATSYAMLVKVHANLLIEQACS